MNNLKPPVLSVLVWLALISGPCLAQSWKTSDKDLGWVRAYLKTNPKTGIAFNFGKAEYFGLVDPKPMNTMGGIDFMKKDFEALTEVMLKGRSGNLKNAKILETEMQSLVQLAERPTLIAYMKQNDLDLLQIINIRSIFTGIRDGKNGLSGNLIAFRYQLFIESRFYFRQLVEDNQIELSASRAELHWLPILTGSDETVYTEATLTNLTKPETKQQVAPLLTIRALQSKTFNDINAWYAGLDAPGNQAEFEGIVLGFEGGAVKINKKKELLSGLSPGSNNFSVIETINGDNANTFWTEQSYDIVVANLKLSQTIDDYSLCNITELSNGYKEENLMGLPILLTKDARPAIGGYVPDITSDMKFTGKKYTILEFEKMKLGKKGIAAVDKDYYKSKEILHPKTEINQAAKPNVVPSKEGRLLAKIRRFETEGHKIAVMFTPGYMKLEKPIEETASPTTNSTPASANSNTKTYSLGDRPGSSQPPACKYEPGSAVFPDGYLSTGADIAKALNDGFATTIFEPVDEDMIPVKERKMLGQVSKTPDFSNTQYKIAVLVNLEGKYEVSSNTLMLGSSSNAKGGLQVQMYVSSEVKIVEYEIENKQRFVTVTTCATPVVTKAVSDCPATIDAFATALGPLENQLSFYQSARDKMLKDLITKQSK